MKKIKNPKFSFSPSKPFRFKLDTDRDGVLDWKDCRPFDRRRQHVGPSELEGDIQQVHKKVTINAMNKYEDPISAEKRVKTAIAKFFMHPDQEEEIKGFENFLSQQFNLQPTESVKVSWHDPSKYILDAYDMFYDIHHYVYMVGKKTVSRTGAPVLLLPITSLDRERVGLKGLDDILDWARKELKKAVKENM